MNKRFVRNPLVLLLAGLSPLSTPALSADTATNTAMLQRSEILEAIRSPDLRSAQERITRAIGSPHADWATVESVISSLDLGDIERELLLYGALMRARDIEADQQAIDFVSRLQDYDSKVFVRHEEGPLPVAVYPIAAAARGTLNFWHRSQVKREASIALAAGDMSGLLALRREGSDDYAGVLDALREADALTKHQARDWLAARAVGNDFYEARMVTALALQDRPLASELLRTGNGAATIRLLRDVRTAFDADAAFELLRQATSNPFIASAAIFELDRLRHAGTRGRIDDYLLDLLADPLLGASAATVIARRNDPALLARVFELLTSPVASGSEQARAALTLTLADSQYSRTVLGEAVEGGGIADPDLREELVEWLQR